MYANNFAGGAARAIGVVMVVDGIVSWSAASSAWWSGATYRQVCCGYWCGSVFLVAGIGASSAAGIYRTNHRITTCFILTLISFAFASIQLGVSASGLQIDLDDNSLLVNYWWRVASNITLVSTATVQIILSSILAIICIEAICTQSDVEPSTGPWQQPAVPMQQIQVTSTVLPAGYSQPQNFSYFTYNTVPQNQATVNVVSTQSMPPAYSF